MELAGSGQWPLLSKEENMGKEKVVITGMGIVSAIGNDIETFFDNALKGKSGVSENDKFKVPVGIGGMNGIVRDFELQDDKDRIHTFLYHAVKQALKQAGLYNQQDELMQKDIPVYYATAVANIEKMEDVFGKGMKTERNREYFAFNRIADDIKMNFGLEEESCAIITGCTGGLDAVGYAYREICEGRKKIAVTGSVDCPITPFTVGAFAKINATTVNRTYKASRPFDVERDGFVLSEGCGAFILESESHAKARGAKILAQVLGYGSCNSAEHMTNINPDGASIVKSIELALNDAKITREKIDLINAHGSSTEQNDLAEVNAIKLVFGNRAKEIPVTSTKSLVGHALSASNSIEIISSVLTLLSGKIQPTINLEHQDEKCDINVFTDVSKSDNYKVNHILKLSSGFSGIHSALILKRYEEER